MSMNQIKSLTSLRGFFAITILLYHFLELFGIYIQPMSQGVAGFFGLSGFLLYRIYTDETFYFIALPLIIKYKPSSKWILSLGIASFIAQYILFWNAGVYQANLNPTPIWMTYASLPFQFLPFAIGIVLARRTKGITVKPWMQKIDRLLGNRVLIFFGTISFGVYLFHVPMFGWFGPWLGIPATFALATATYFLFEKGAIDFARDKTQ